VSSFLYKPLIGSQNISSHALKVNKGNKLKKIQKEMNNGKFGNLIPR
jgi:hypothetical protein